MSLPHHLSRRRVLTGSALAVGATGALEGCSTVLDTPVDTGPRTLAELGPDEREVVDLLTRLRATEDLLTSTGARFPRLGVRLSPLRGAVHTHLVTLRQSAKAGRMPTDASAAPLAPAGDRTAALSRVTTDATALRAAYLAAARSAESGQFARLLASMGCAVSQRLGALGVDVDLLVAADSS